MLYLATIRHIVKAARGVFVRACTAIELVRPEVVFITSGSKSIVAIPTIEDILAIVSGHIVVALLAIEVIFAPISAHNVVELLGDGAVFEGSGAGSALLPRLGVIRMMVVAPLLPLAAGMVHALPFRVVPAQAATTIYPLL